MSIFTRSIVKPLAAIAAAAALTGGSTHAAPILLGGFGGTSPTAIQSPAATDVAVTLSSSQVAGVPTDGFSQINLATWGSAALDVAAPTIGNGDDLRRAVIQEGTNTAWTLQLQVTNNASLDLSLAQFHFISKKDLNNEGPNAGTLAYTAGDLTDGTGASTAFAIPNGTNNTFDIDLSGFLTDTTLAPGESATFTWAHGAPEDPAGNTALRLDNVAISGELIPEPASLALLGMGGLLIAGRRRK